MAEKKNIFLPLTVFDLKRFSKKIIKDIEYILPEYTYYIFVGAKGKLSAAYQEFGAKYQKNYPIYFRGRLLGYLALKNKKENFEISNIHDALIPKIIKIVLDKLRLYKMQICDCETGFYNKTFFNYYLQEFFKRENKRQSKTLKLDLEETSYILIFLKYNILDLRPEFNLAKDFKELMKYFETYLPKILITARLENDKLAFLFEAKEEKVNEFLKKSLDKYSQSNPELYPVVAWAKYPGDLDLQPYHDLYCYKTYSEVAKEKAKQFCEKAEIALFHCQNLFGAANIISFSDLIKTGGRISQILPLDRVVINIGRLMGVRPGQVFLISSTNEKHKIDLAYKGELTVYEAADNYALAYVNELKKGLHLAQGDFLLFSREAQGSIKSSAQYFERANFSSVIDVLPIESPELFLDLINKEFKNKKITLALIRMDNYEKLRSTLGFNDCEKQFLKLIEKLKEKLPKTKLLAPFGPGILIAAWPNVELNKIKNKAEEFVSNLAKNDDISFSLAAWPFKIEENIIDALEKTLNEASLTGIRQIVVYGALALNISGDYLFEQGDLFGALKEYEKGLVYDDEYINLINSRGVCLGRLADFNSALESFEKIIKLNPSDMKAYYNMGYTYILSGQLKEAEEALKKSLQLAPDNFETLYYLGKITLELGEAEQAFNYLVKASELKDKKSSVFKLLGEAALLMQNNEAALKAFKKAVKVDPEDAYAFSALGVLYDETYNDLEVAQSLFQKSVELDPSNSLYRHRLGRILYNLGDFVEAEYHLKKAIEYGAKTPDVHYKLGRLAEELANSKDKNLISQGTLNQDSSYKPVLNNLINSKVK